MNQTESQQYLHFRENGYVVLENALTPDEITRYTELSSITTAANTAG